MSHVNRHLAPMMRLDWRAGQYMASQTQITSTSSFKPLNSSGLCDHI
jgi:hypothetical protein